MMAWRNPALFPFSVLALSLACVALSACRSVSPGASAALPSSAPQPLVAPPSPSPGAGERTDGPVEVSVEVPGFAGDPLVARAYPDPDNCLSWRYSDAPYAVLARGYRPDHHVLSKAVRLRGTDGERAHFAPGYVSVYAFYLTSEESPELLARLTAAIRAALVERRAKGLENYRRCPVEGTIRLRADYLAGDLRVEPAGPIADLRVGMEARVGSPILGDLRPLLLELDATNPAAEPAAARALAVGTAPLHVADLVASGGPRGQGVEHRIPVLVRGFHAWEIQWAFDGSHAYTDEALAALQRRVLCARSEYGLSRAYFADRVETQGFVMPVADPDCLDD